MKRYLFLLALSASTTFAGEYSVVDGKWLLFKGDTQYGAPFATKWDCADAAATLNLTASYECRATMAVNVVATTTPTVTFTVAPTTIKRGAGVVLTWASTFATKCESSGKTWFGMSGDVFGSQWAFPEADAEYAVTCYGPDGVVVSAAPIVRVLP